MASAIRKDDHRTTIVIHLVSDQWGSSSNHSVQRLGALPENTWWAGLLNSFFWCWEHYRKRTTSPGILSIYCNHPHHQFSSSLPILILKWKQGWNGEQHLCFRTIAPRTKLLKGMIYSRTQEEPEHGGMPCLNRKDGRLNSLISYLCNLTTAYQHNPVPSVSFQYIGGGFHHRLLSFHIHGTSEDSEKALRDR